MKPISQSTEDKYTAIIKEAHEAGAYHEDVLKWLGSKINGQTPEGTILPLRAAVKRYLISLGYNASEVDAAMPSSRGVAGESTGPLSQEQLVLFHMACDELVPEPSRTLLLLLPTTGLTVSEACQLKARSVTPQGLHVEGMRGARRVVPLDAVAWKVLRPYLNDYTPKTWLFPLLKTGAPIGDHGVRKYTRKISEAYPDLEGLSPHTLRVTAAHLWKERGLELHQIQELLGHKSIKSTARYFEEEHVDG